LAMGESESGVTLMRVIPRMDAGPMIDCEKVAISAKDTGSSLREKMGLACIPLIQRTLPDLLAQKFSEKIQEESLVTYCRKLTKMDGQIDFSLSAQEIENRSRAFAAWPGCYFLHQDTALKVGSLKIANGVGNLAVGQRLSENLNSLIIGAGSEAVEILALQKPGGRMLPISDFLRGYSIPDEIIFPIPNQPHPLVR
jgi:methionyl-tRNA formyltransferase